MKYKKNTLGTAVLVVFFGVGLGLGLSLLIPGLSLGQATSDGKYCFINQTICISGWPQKLVDKKLLEVWKLGDHDKDGVSDEEDKCDTDPGERVNEGCPDKDLDTVFDNIDKCPASIGARAELGCPMPGEGDIYFGFENDTNGPSTVTITEGMPVDIYWNIKIDALKKSDEGHYSVSFIGASGGSDGRKGEIKQYKISRSREIKLKFKIFGVVKKERSIMVNVSEVHGKWSAKTACSAECGEGEQYRWCSDPAPSGGGTKCLREDGTYAGGYETEVLKCTAKSDCIPRKSVDYCEYQVNYDRSTRCEKEEERTCKGEGKNQRYACIWDHWGSCGAKGMKTVILLTCNVPASGDYPDAPSITFDSEKSEIIARSERGAKLDEVNIIDTDGLTLADVVKNKKSEGWGAYDRTMEWSWKVNNSLYSSPRPLFELTRIIDGARIRSEKTFEFSFKREPSFADVYQGWIENALGGWFEGNPIPRYEFWYKARVQGNPPTWVRMYGDQGFERDLVLGGGGRSDEWYIELPGKKCTGFKSQQNFRVVAGSAYGSDERTIGEIKRDSYCID